MNNDGLKNKQQEMRNETLCKVDTAIAALRAQGRPLTKKNISDESGLSYSTLKKPHVKLHLQAFPEFNDMLIPTEEVYARNAVEINKLRSENIRLKKDLKLAKMELKQRQEMLNDADEKYRRLLFEFQRLQSQSGKIIHI